MKLFTKSRDGQLYSATAEFTDGKITVLRGSKINRRNAPGYRPRKKVVKMLEDESLFDNECYLKKDITFKSLSSAASFVTGRIANGKIVWKTDDGKRVKYSL